MARKQNRFRIKFFNHFSFHLSKRQTFVLSTLFLTLGLMATQSIGVQLRYLAVFALSFFAFGLSVFALRDELSGIEWVTLTILPTLFTTAVALFYFLLPMRLLTRLPVAFLFAFGFYALLLTENIYNVAAIRTIALLRAAHTVGFLITIVTAFLLFDTLFTFHLPSYFQALTTFLISFPLLFQSLWAIILSSGVENRLVFFSIGFAFLMAEIAFSLAFWPVTALVGSLFLTTTFYVLVGMGQRHFDQRLFQKEIYEFIIVGTSMFLLMLFATKWSG